MRMREICSGTFSADVTDLQTLLPHQLCPWEILGDNDISKMSEDHRFENNHKWLLFFNMEFSIFGKWQQQINTADNNFVDRR